MGDNLQIRVWASESPPCDPAVAGFGEPALQAAFLRDLSTGYHEMIGGTTREVGSPLGRR